MLSQETLDALWDFDDPVASEHRLRAAAESASPADATELHSQVARALGLQRRFDEAHAILDVIERSAPAPVTVVRIALERGRIENSAGRPERAIPLFTVAADTAAQHDLEFLRIDALHMLAIADAKREAVWSAEGIRSAEAATDPRTRRWTVALHTNHGWSRFDAGDVEGAVTAFESAVRWADEVGTADHQRYAREALREATDARSAQRTDREP